jgi:hypothetical protein
VTKAESAGYGRELEVAIAGLKEMHKRGIKVSWFDGIAFGMQAAFR